MTATNLVFLKIIKCSPNYYIKRIIKISHNYAKNSSPKTMTPNSTSVINQFQNETIKP